MTYKINLALQGGGAHGAFTWGVLDRLLDESDVEVAAISGTSAGALNGAAFKAGYVNGGRDGARESLNWVWRQVGAVTDSNLAKWIAPFAPATELYTQALTYSPAYFWWETASRALSPYAFGGVIKNPLERVIRELEWDALCASDGPELYVCATNVRTGKIRVFKDHEVTTKAILASACLPTLFEAVEIDDPKTGKKEAYWDGWYTGNPALFPLFPNYLPDDIVIVNINPLYRDTVPQDSQSIQNRINEISFNTSLLRELRAINFVKRLIADGSVKKGRMKDVNVHLIEDDALMTELSVATKMIAMPVILSRLKEAGRLAMDQFLRDHKHTIGKSSSIDLSAMFD